MRGATLVPSAQTGDGVEKPGTAEAAGAPPGRVATHGSDAGTIRHGRRVVLSAAGLIAMALFAPERVAAQGLFEGWRLGAVTIYGWVPGMEGGQDGPDGEPIVSLDSVGILDVLDFAFMGTAEFRRDRVGLVFDLNYADLGADGSARGAIIPGADPASASVDTSLLMTTGAVTYRVLDDRAWMDLYGGFRYFDVTSDFTARVPALGFEADRSGSADWVDGIIGVRGRAPLGDRIGVTALADVGGFGIGASSDLTWQVQATLDYSFTDRLVGRLGYRYMSIDYDDSGLRLDLDLSGPLVGLTWTF